MNEHKPDDKPRADGPAEISLSAPRILGEGFRRLERYSVRLKNNDGTSASYSRDVLRVGSVVGVLPVDPARGEVVLIRQFRLGAHLATGSGEFLEIVAGHVDPGEQPTAAAQRECAEEIGVAPRSLHRLFTFMPTPGLSDEIATMYLGIVDASRVPERAGASDENEDIRPMRLSIDNALAVLADGRVHNAYMMLALQWLALNRERLGAYTR
jgi:ADP-ribose pyrophosphatase